MAAAATEKRKTSKPAPKADYTELEAWLNRGWGAATATRRWDAYRGAMAALRLAGLEVSEQNGRHKVMR